MGCKATKTGVLMKLLVCASIYMYVLLFGVVNSNKLYLLAFFSYLNYFIVFICFANVHILQSLYFLIGSNSKLLCSGMQESSSSSSVIASPKIEYSRNVWSLLMRHG